MLDRLVAVREHSIDISQFTGERQNPYELEEVVDIAYLPELPSHLPPGFICDSVVRAMSSTVTECASNQKLDFNGFGISLITELNSNGSETPIAVHMRLRYEGWNIIGPVDSVYNTPMIQQETAGELLSLRYVNLLLSRGRTMARLNGNMMISSSDVPPTICRAMAENDELGLMHRMMANKWASLKQDFK